MTKVDLQAKTTANSMGAVAGSRIYAQAAQLATFLFAARILGPADFGIFAIVQAIALGLTILAAAGWREQAIVRPSLTSFAFFSAICAALFAGVLLCGVAFGFQHATGEREIVILALCFAVSVPMLSVASFFEGLALRDGRVHLYAAGAVAGETACLVVALIGLWLGFGLAALGYARVALALLYFTCGALAARPPRPRCGRALTQRSVVRFVRGILIARAWDYTNSNAATLLSGLLLGPAAAGIYRAAVRMVGSAFEAVTEAARTVAWRGISTQNRRIEAAQAKALLAAIWLVAFPACFGLALIGPDLVGVALGPEWAGAGILVGVLAFRRLALSSYIALEPTLASRNQTSRAARISARMAMLSLFFLFVTGPAGVLAIAIGQLAAGLIGGFLSLRELVRVTALPLSDIVQVAAIPIIGSLVMSLFILFIQQRVDGVLGLFLCVLVGFLIYCAIIVVIWADGRRFLAEIWRGKRSMKT